MDNQDFQDLFDAEGLYNELQDNLTSFYENFEALGQNLTKRERARRNQMYEEQMAQLEEQLSMLEEIYDVSGDSIGGLGEDFNDVLQGVRNDLKKYQVAYKRAYESVGKERDKFFEGMEESFGDFADRMTSIFTAFKVDQIADTLTESAESYTKNLRDIQNVRGYSNAELDKLRAELSGYVEIIHNSGGKLSINDYSDKVEKWVDHGFRDDMAAAMGLQDEYMEKTLGVDLSSIEDLVDQMWYSGYDVVGLIEKSTKYLKALKKSSEFQEADIGSILDTMSEGANWAAMMATDSNDYETIMKGIESAYTVADANGLDTKMLDEIFSGLLDRSNTEIRQQLAGLGVDTNQMYQQIMDRDFTGALQTLVEQSADRVKAFDNTSSSLTSQSLGTNMDWIYQLRALQMSGGIDWDETNSALSAIGDGVVSLEDEMNTYHVSLVERLGNWISSSKLGQTISSAMTALGIDASDAALLSTSVLQLLELKKLNGSKGVGGLFNKLFKGGSASSAGGAAGAKGAGLLSKILGSTGTLTNGTLAGGSGVLGGLASTGSVLGSTAKSAAGMAAGGAAGIAGGVLGGVALIDAANNLITAQDKATWKERDDKTAEGALGVGSVAAGAGAGALIGSVVPGLGTAIGALVGAGVGGVASLIWGDDWAESLTDILDGTRDMKKAMERATKAQEDYQKAISNKEQAEKDYAEAQVNGTEQAKKSTEANLKLAEAEERLAAIRNREAAKQVVEEMSTSGVQYQKSYADAEYQANQANSYLDYYDLIGQIKTGIDSGKVEAYQDENGLWNYRSSDSNYQDLINQVNSADMKQVGLDNFAFMDDYQTGMSSLYNAINDYSYNSDDWAEKGEEATNNLANANAAMTEAMANMDRMTSQVMAYVDSVAKLNGYGSVEDMANADPSTLNWQSKEALGMVTDAYNAVGNYTGIDKGVASAGATANNKKIVDADLKSDLDDWYQKVALAYKENGNDAAQEIEKGELSDWLEKYLGVPTDITDKYHVDTGKPDFMKDYENSVFDDYLKFKTGIGYVPDDNQPALLHKGEAVLTRQQADDWRQTRGLNNDSESEMIASWKDIWVKAFESSKEDMIETYADVVEKSSTKGAKKAERRSLFSSLFGFVNGSHANGLDYVPFDGYIAELHEGEAVIPKEQNPYIQPVQSKTITVEKNDGDVYDNSELVRVVRQGFEAVIKKMESTKKEENTDSRPIQKTKKPFQSAALYNL